jgi:hypothetical protein
MSDRLMSGGRGAISWPTDGGWQSSNLSYWGRIFITCAGQRKNDLMGYQYKVVAVNANL